MDDDDDHHFSCHTHNIDTTPIFPQHHLEMDDEEESINLLNQYCFEEDDDLLIRNIFDDHQSYSHGNTLESNFLNNDSNNFIICEGTGLGGSGNTNTYTLCFDNSTVLPNDVVEVEHCAVPNTHNNKKQSSKSGSSSCSSISSSKRRGNGNGKELTEDARKKSRTRTSAETIHHIMAERKRRQDLTQKFIALSATIPGLKKIDKASVLCEAINYVKQLQERVRELEKINTEKTTTTTKRSSITSSSSSHHHHHSQVCTSKGGATAATTTTTTNKCNVNNEAAKCDQVSALPEMEARVLGKQVLIRIHCHVRQQNDIMMNVMAFLPRIHLSLLSCTLLPFGNSASTIITITAQMEDEYCLTPNDLLNHLNHHHLFNDSHICS
ncbi:transcription factor bHLH18-like [Senna tora]|uniref:Transcription factor bHLH18-like n=1 Tax=Senna tora TaxID=362788 RepID=A0A834T5Z1_9FABA|nr:transcription factor bHLH18-like [Senna tora]